MKICIDAGHNYSNYGTGAVGNGLKEQDINFYIADKLKALLVASRHSVKMTRSKLEENVGTSNADSLNKRASIANQFGADLFISIHCNAGGGTGTETLIYAKGGKAEEYANKIQKAIVQKLGTRDRGVKERPKLVVLRKTSMPAVLVETAFIDTKADAVLLKNRQSDFASAIFEAVTGQKAELESVNDIVWELANRGIITNKDLWLKKLEEDEDSYWLAKKSANYIRRNV